MIYKNIIELIGRTPLVRINKLNKNSKVVILAKLEFMNPGGSIKDRIGLSMVRRAERENKLGRNGTIVEATGAGNTGIGLAIVAAVLGYKVVLTIPDKVSEEKRNLLRSYGADIKVSPTAVPPENPQSYYMVAKRLAKTIPGSHQPDQYSNMANPQAHYDTTGPEIWKDTRGKVTHVVVGMGTGGTITGIARYLKEKNKNIKVIGVDSVGSIYLEYFKTGKYPKSLKTWKMEGIGEDFVPKTIDLSLIDEVIQVSDSDAFATARELAKSEAILAGGTSGAALFAALMVSSRVKNGLIVTVFPDSGRSYLSKFYNDAWMRENNFKS